MTQPKFPWALLVIIAMFTWVAIAANTPVYFRVFAAFAVMLTAAAAIYQAIPRKDDSVIDDDDLNPAEDPWSDESRP